MRNLHFFGLIHFIAYLSLTLWTSASLAQMPVQSTEYQNSTKTALPKTSVLTSREVEWLNTRPVLKVGMMQNWVPISFQDKNSSPAGISLDYLYQVNSKLGNRLKFEIIQAPWEVLLKMIQSEQLDILLDATDKPSRRHFLSFTDNYLIIPHVYITRKQFPEITNPSLLNGKTIALEKGFGNVEYFQNHFPKILQHEYVSTQAALEAVSRGKADAYIGNRAVAIHLINQNLLENLQIQTLEHPISSELAFGVRANLPVLRSVLDKGLQALTPEEKNLIMDKWVNLNYRALWLKEVWLYIAIAGTFIMLLLLWSFYLKHKVRVIHQLLYQQTNFDALTGLANRTLFKDSLLESIEEAKNQQHKVLVLACQIKQLGQLQSMQGHTHVDALLEKLATVLLAHHKVDLAGRWSDNVFCLMVKDITGQQFVEHLASELVETIHYEFHNLSGASLSFRFAGNVFPEGGKNAVELLDNLFLALENTSEHSESNFEFFESQTNTNLHRRWQLGTDMLTALPAGDFKVFYQPKVNIHNGEIQGFEALLRWQHRTLGFISPEEFIPIAEANGFIQSLGDFVLEASLKAVTQWKHATGREIFVAINLSPMQLKQTRFIDFMQEQLRHTHVNPYLLEIEITEGILLQDSAINIAHLTQLKNLGMKLSMDDFGKGYSSLSYLRRYPFDVLKIDKEFVQDLEQDPGSQALIKSVIAMAKELKLTVVAEGVETQEQLVFLQQRHCDLVQGYYFSPAVDFEQSVQLLTRNNYAQRLQNDKDNQDVCK